MELTLKLQPKVPMFSVKNLTLNNTTEPAVVEGKIELTEQDIADINIINAALLEGNIVFNSSKEEKEFAALLKKAVDLNNKANKAIEQPAKGKTIAISLPKGRVIWQSTDGEILLNSFQNITSLTIDVSTLTPSQKGDIISGIETGQLVSTETELKKLTSNAADIDMIFEEYDDTFLKFIRFTLDSPLDQFKNLFDKSFKHEHIVLIKKIEIKERNRKEYLDIIEKALLTVK